MGDKSNPTGLNLKLKYPHIDPTTDNPDDYPPQPVRVLLKGNKTMTKLVPVTPFTEHDKCIGCIAEENLEVHPRTDCFQLPQCDGAIYVHANKTNLIRHMIWRLENDQ